jgi:surface protein
MLWLHCAVAAAAPSPCDCQYVRVTGAESVQSQRMGIYTRTDSLVGNRSVYLQPGSPAAQSLYYDTNHGWSIHEGTDGLAGVDGPTSAEACPHNASGAWTAWNGSTFSSEYDVQVECMDFAACDCERFLVSGAESAQPGKMGYYTRAGNDFHARSVYTRAVQNASDLSYLFLGSNNWWQVAQELEADDAHKNLSLISLPYGTARRDATCPEPNATWWVWNGTAWSDGYAVQVACSPCSQPPSQPPLPGRALSGAPISGRVRRLDVTYAFTDTASLRTAAQEYNVDAADATATYGPISSWGVSAITSLYQLFSGLGDFNADISSWNTSGVTDMSFMFSSASAFNQPLSFDTSSVTNMARMFYVRSTRIPCQQPAQLGPPCALLTPPRLLHALPLPRPACHPSSYASLWSRQSASAFNQPLSLDTSSVTTMGYMFFVRFSRAPASSLYTWVLPARCSRRRRLSSPSRYPGPHVAPVPMLPFGLGREHRRSTSR